MSETTDTRVRREHRQQAMQDNIADMLSHPIKSLWTRLAVSFMVAIITGGISAYISVQIISGEVANLSQNQRAIANTQQIQFQELSQRIDNLVYANRTAPPP